MSQPLVVSIPHRLGKEEALRRLQERLRQRRSELWPFVQCLRGSLDRRLSSVPDQRARPASQRRNRCGRRPRSFEVGFTVAFGQACRDVLAVDPQGRDVVAREKVTSWSRGTKSWSANRFGEEQSRTPKAHAHDLSLGGNDLAGLFTSGLPRKCPQPTERERRPCVRDQVETLPQPPPRPPASPV